MCHQAPIQEDILRRDTSADAEGPLDLSRQQLAPQEVETRRKVDGAYDNSYINPRMRRHPEMTPRETKDANYWERRNRNNAAARRSRRSRRAREADLAEYAACLERKNSALETEIRLLRVQLASIRNDSTRQEKLSP